MARELDEAKLRAAGWVEDCGGLWHASWMDPATWFDIDAALLRELARSAVEANAKRNAELEAMSPEDREKAIQEWAAKLAGEVADLND